MQDRLNVNPTRMELTNLKARQNTAIRGHKLLKDKSDEMVRQFMLLIKKNQNLRKQVEKELHEVLQGFLLAKAVSDETVVSQSLSLPVTNLSIEVSSKNIMSVNVPNIKIEKKGSENIFPYSFSNITSEIDDSIVMLSELSDKLIKLAEVEKTCNMLANEIERNRRRVNALEYVMIPQIENTIKYITMKLDESERSNIVRLMKVKEIIKDK